MKDLNISALTKRKKIQGYYLGYKTIPGHNGDVLKLHVFKTKNSYSCFIGNAKIDLYLTDKLIGKMTLIKISLIKDKLKIKYDVFYDDELTIKNNFMIRGGEE